VHRNQAVGAVRALVSAALPLITQRGDGGENEEFEADNGDQDVSVVAREKKKKKEESDGKVYGRQGRRGRRRQRRR